MVVGQSTQTCVLTNNYLYAKIYDQVSRINHACTYMVALLQEALHYNVVSHFYIDNIILFYQLSILSYCGGRSRIIHDTGIEIQ